MQKLMLAMMAAWLTIFSCAEKPAVKGPKLHWLSLEEAAAALQKEKKPLLIDVYTDWCGWCKVMDRKTYSNRNVVAYIQDRFYPVRINAETRETLLWNNKRYAFSNDYRANEFAVFLTYGQLSFPTTVIIPTDNSGPQPIPGYLEPKELEVIVKYFGEGVYGKQPFDAYRQQFKTSW